MNLACSAGSIRLTIGIEDANARRLLPASIVEKLQALLAPAKAESVTGGNQMLQLIPPGQAGLIDQAGGDIDGCRDGVLAQNRQSQGEIVQITVIEGHDHAARLAAFRKPAAQSLLVAKHS
jgi:hypothetical protein